MCRLCDERFWDLADFQRHLNEDDHRPFSRHCCCCPAEMNRAGDMRRHIQRYHGWSYPAELAPPRTRDELREVGWENRERQGQRTRIDRRSTPELPPPEPERPAEPSMTLGRGRGRARALALFQPAVGVARYLPPPPVSDGEPEGGGYRPRESISTEEDAEVQAVVDTRHQTTQTEEPPRPARCVIS